MVKVDDVYDTHLITLLAVDEEGMHEYRFIEAAVKIALLSKYPIRQGLARRRLSHFLDGDFELGQENYKGEIYTYIRFGNDERYFFVARYSSLIQDLEPKLTEEEKKNWAKA